MDPRLNIHASVVRTYDLDAPRDMPLDRFVPGRYRGETVEVSAQHMDDLRKIRAAIAISERLLPMPPGNQQPTLERFGGEAAKRDYAYRALTDKHDYQDDDTENLSKSAVQVEGVNCNGRMHLLRALLSQIGVSGPLHNVEASFDHQYLLVGDYRTPDKLAVGDSWPIFGDAHQFDHSLLRKDFSPDRVLNSMPGNRPIGSLHELENQPRMSQEEVDALLSEYDINTQPGLHYMAGKYGEGVYLQEHGMTNPGVVYRDRDNPDRALRQETTLNRYLEHYASPLNGQAKRDPLMPYED